jgi:hypothetical protein
VKLIDETNEKALRKIWIELTRAELLDLFEHIRSYVEEDAPEREPGWHCHLEARDGSGAELSLSEAL